MSASPKGRPARDVMTDILVLTREMANSRDPDFLIAAVDKRGKLMDEYDRISHSATRDAETVKMVDEIIKLNKIIEASLKSMHAEAKLELEGSVTRGKLLNYTNNAISSSGSYMDYKK